jgi:hypothetical protein
MKVLYRLKKEREEKSCQEERQRGGRAENEKDMLFAETDGVTR